MPALVKILEVYLRIWKANLYFTR